MVAEWDETCVWCASKTKSRCGKCAEAGIAIFFCSPDHQKLVWDVHKLVCGPGKANPFVRPLLSKDESREVIEHMDESTGVLKTYGEEHNTVAKCLKESYNISRAALPEIIKYVTVSKDGQVAAADTTFQQLLLANIRAFEHSRVTAPAPAQTLAGIMSFAPSSPWCAASSWDLHRGRDVSVSLEDHGREPWRAKARHYALMDGAVFCLAFRGHVDVGMTFPQHRQRLADLVATAAAGSSSSFAARYRAETDEDEKLAQRVSKKILSS